MADLDNYAYPLAYRLKDAGLGVGVVHETAQRAVVRADRSCPRDTPAADRRAGRGNDSVDIDSRLQGADLRRRRRAAELPAGPVRLELAFVVGPDRNWLNLWKQTIDSLDPLLGSADPYRYWNPLDGRITELGMHLTVDPALRYDVVIGIAATPA